MYRYKVYDSKTGWIESAEDIRKLAKDVNKAIQILEKELGLDETIIPVLKAEEPEETEDPEESEEGESNDD